jgi:hypothetical protein
MQTCAISASFILTHPDQAICYMLCSKLSWSHNRLIMRVDAQQTLDLDGMQRMAFA